MPELILRTTSNGWNPSEFTYDQLLTLSDVIDPNTGTGYDCLNLKEDDGWGGYDAYRDDFPFSLDDINM